MKKKIISMLLCASLLISLAPASVVSEVKAEDAADTPVTFSDDVATADAEQYEVNYVVYNGNGGTLNPTLKAAIPYAAWIVWVPNDEGKFSDTRIAFSSLSYDAAEQYYNENNSLFNNSLVLAQQWHAEDAYVDGNVANENVQLVPAEGVDVSDITDYNDLSKFSDTKYMNHYSSSVEHGYIRVLTNRFEAPADGDVFVAWNTQPDGSGEWYVGGQMLSDNGAAVVGDSYADQILPRPKTTEPDGTLNLYAIWANSSYTDETRPDYLVKSHTAANSGNTMYLPMRVQFKGNPLGSSQPIIFNYAVTRTFDDPNDTPGPAFEDSFSVALYGEQPRWVFYPLTMVCDSDVYSRANFSFKITTTGNNIGDYVKCDIQSTTFQFSFAKGFPEDEDGAKVGKTIKVNNNDVHVNPMGTAVGDYFGGYTYIGSGAFNFNNISITPNVSYQSWANPYVSLQYNSNDTDDGGPVYVLERYVDNANTVVVPANFNSLSEALSFIQKNEKIAVNTDGSVTIEIRADLVADHGGSYKESIVDALVDQTSKEGWNLSGVTNAANSSIHLTMLNIVGSLNNMMEPVQVATGASGTKNRCNIYLHGDGGTVTWNNIQFDGPIFFDSVQAPGTAVSSITLSQTSMELNVGATGTITATVLPADATNKQLSWSSSAANVATVDGNGVVTAVGEGTATITASASANDGSGVTATCVVTVTEPQFKISLNKSKVSLTVAGYTNDQGSAVYFTILTPTVEGASVDDITWTSTNPNIIVNDDGYVFAFTTSPNQTATITAEVGGVTASCEITTVSSCGHNISTLYLNPGYYMNSTFCVLEVGYCSSCDVYKGSSRYHSGDPCGFCGYSASSAASVASYSLLSDEDMAAAAGALETAGMETYAAAAASEEDSGIEAYATVLDAQNRGKVVVSKCTFNAATVGHLAALSLTYRDCTFTGSELDVAMKISDIDANGSTGSAYSFTADNCVLSGFNKAFHLTDDNLASTYTIKDCRITINLINGWILNITEAATQKTVSVTGNYVRTKTLPASVTQYARLLRPNNVSYLDSNKVTATKNYMTCNFLEAAVNSTTAITSYTNVKDNYRLHSYTPSDTNHTSPAKGHICSVCLQCVVSYSAGANGSMKTTTTNSTYYYLTDDAFSFKTATGLVVDKGEQVVFTVTPVSSYRLKALTLNGGNVTSSVSGTTYTFTNTGNFTACPVLYAEFEKGAGNLTISKTISGTVVDGQVFIFEVSNGSGFKTTVTLTSENFGTGSTASVVIHDLTYGSYTIKELTNWSWQYTCTSSDSQTINFGTVTSCSFTNTYKGSDGYLTDQAGSVENIHGSTNGGQTGAVKKGA